MATSSQADLVRPSNCGLAVYGPQVTCGRALSRALKRFLWASCGSLKRHCTIFSVQPPSAHTPPCKYIYILLTNVRGSRTLRDSIPCNKGVDLEVKGRVYVALVLSILLYGSESWSLRADLFQRLRSFHNYACRSMCRIAMAHTIRHHISQKPFTNALASTPLTATTTTDFSSGEGTSRAWADCRA